MLSEFGRIIRKIRIDKGLRLYDMAKDLGKSSAWLSYIETGKKSIPPGFADEVADRYQLTAQQRKELNQAAARATREFRLHIGENASATRINTAYALARKFDSMDDETLEEFLKIINKGE